LGANPARAERKNKDCNSRPNQISHGRIPPKIRCQSPCTRKNYTPVNPSHENAEAETKDTQAAAAALGRELKVLTAGSEREIETAFAAMVQLRVDALYVSPDPLFSSRNALLVGLAGHH
jgi:hypothetical protein